MKERLSIPVRKGILDFEKKEARKAARAHIYWVLSGKISTWEKGRQLSFQEQLYREAELAKKKLPLGNNSKIFICLRCGECCYWSYLDNTRRLRPDCQKHFFIPRRIINDRFLPAECRIHNDPVISYNERQPDPYSFPPRFNIIINGSEYRDFSEEKGIEFFGEERWETIRKRNTLGVFHSPGAQFGPCVDGVRIWEAEKNLHPNILLPEGVSEQLEVVRVFREEIDKYLRIFGKGGKELLAQKLH